MPMDTALEDEDFVASILRRDAQAHRDRHSAGGLDTFRSTKRSSNAPKPNTRFLNNVIRNTNTHNAALKAKEEQESRARLKGLGKDADGQHHDAARPSKRSRTGERPGRWASAFGGLAGSHGPSKDTKKGDERDDQGERHPARVHGQKIREPSTRETAHRRHEGRSGEETSRALRHGRERSGRRHRDSRSRSPSRSRDRHRRRRSRSPESNNRRRRRSSARSDDCSDPLDDLIGPLPPGSRPRRSRGQQSSAMDKHFDPSYDPKTDVSLDPDEGDDDWDMALKALRDRTKWKAKGTERLKAAGFTDEEIRKSERNSNRKSGDVDSVAWKRKGEKREWDHGKVVDGGRIDVKASWATK